MNVLELSLSHFSSEPAINMHKCKQEKNENMKPNGLWVSVDGEDDWPSWCLGENWTCSDDSLRYRHKVTLAPDHKVKHLLSVEDAAEWTRRFRSDPRTDKLWQVGVRSRLQLDWHRAAKKYDGLIIHPYRWEIRLDPDFSWYYGWDCASGCIWNPRSVVAIEMVERTDLPDRIKAARTAEIKGETDAC